MGKRQAEAVGTRRFPTRGEAVPKGLKGLFVPNTHSPARKASGGAPFCPKAEGPGRVVCAR